MTEAKTATFRPISNIIEYENTLREPLAKLLITIVEQIKSSNATRDSTSIMMRPGATPFDAVKVWFDPYIVRVSDFFIDHFEKYMTLYRTNNRIQAETVGQVALVLTGGAALDYYLKDPFGTLDYDFKLTMQMISGDLAYIRYYTYIFSLLRYYLTNSLLAIINTVFNSVNPDVHKLKAIEQIKVPATGNDFFPTITHHLAVQYGVRPDSVYRYFGIVRNGIYQTPVSHQSSVISTTPDQLIGLYGIYYVNLSGLAITMLDMVMLDPLDQERNPPFRCFTSLGNVLDKKACYENPYRASTGPQQGIPFIIDPVTKLKYVFIVYDLYRMLFIVRTSKPARYLEKIMRLIDNLHSYSPATRTEAMRLRNAREPLVFNFKKIQTGAGRAQPLPYETYETYYRLVTDTKTIKN